MTMMTTPPTTESTSIWLRTIWPMAEAAAPSATNTVEKPSTKADGSGEHRALRHLQVALCQ